MNVETIISVEDELIKLCDRYFINPTVQPYAGARYECAYCGAMVQNDGAVDHSYADCPVIKYKELRAKLMKEKG